MSAGDPVQVEDADVGQDEVSLLGVFERPSICLKQRKTLTSVSLLFGLVAVYFLCFPRQLPDGDMDILAEKADSQSLLAFQTARLLSDKSKRRRFVLFRCLPDDCAGGFGDAVAGVFGAAYMALAMGRELKIEWPQLSLIYQENLVQWKADYSEMNISEADQRILNMTNMKEGAAGYSNIILRGLSRDVAVLNGWDTTGSLHNLWQSNPSGGRVLVYSGSKAGSVNWFNTLPNIDDLMDFWKLYHALYDALFRLKPAFISKTISLQVTAAGGMSQQASIPFVNVLRVLDDRDVFSVAAHIRTDARTGRAEAAMASDAECDSIDTPAFFNQRLQCLDSLGSNNIVYKKRVLIVFSNSVCVKKHILEYYKTSEAFSEVWTQDLAEPLINNKGRPEGEHQALYQQMMDWNLLRHVSMYAVTTAYSSLSGFISSAIISSSTEKKLYELAQCKPMARNWLCADRFC